MRATNRWAVVLAGLVGFLMGTGCSSGTNHSTSANDGSLDANPESIPEAGDVPSGSDDRKSDGGQGVDAGDVGQPEHGADGNAEHGADGNDDMGMVAVVDGGTDLAPDGGVDGGDAAGDAADVAEAGPGDAIISAICGGDVPLASACSHLCSQLDNNCADANLQFADFDTCVNACLLPTWSCGSPGDTSGNTIFCRIGHSNMTDVSPDTECVNAGPNSPACQ